MTASIEICGLANRLAVALHDLETTAPVSVLAIPAEHCRRLPDGNWPDVARQRSAAEYELVEPSVIAAGVAMAQSQLGDLPEILAAWDDEIAQELTDLDSSDRRMDELHSRIVILSSAYAATTLLPLSSTHVTPPVWASGPRIGDYRDLGLICGRLRDAVRARSQGKWSDHLIPRVEQAIAGRF